MFGLVLVAWADLKSDRTGEGKFVMTDGKEFNGRGKRKERTKEMGGVGFKGNPKNLNSSLRKRIRNQKKLVPRVI